MVSLFQKALSGEYDFPAEIVVRLLTNALILHLQ